MSFSVARNLESLIPSGSCSLKRARMAVSACSRARTAAARWPCFRRSLASAVRSPMVSTRLFVTGNCRGLVVGDTDGSVFGRSASSVTVFSTEWDEHEFRLDSATNTRVAHNAVAIAAVCRPIAILLNEGAMPVPQEQTRRKSKLDAELRVGCEDQKSYCCCGDCVKASPGAAKHATYTAPIAQADIHRKIRAR